jgi:sugar phosphate isomerase/epimerase
MNSTSRRTFLKTSAAVMTAACTGVGRLAAQPLAQPIGLQLYSVRDLLPKDFDGTLAKVHAAGYLEVEAAGYYDRKAPEFLKAMDRAGLQCTSTHHPMGVLKPHLDEMVAYGHELGLKYMVCSSAMRKDPSAQGKLTLDDWRWMADELNHAGEKVKAAGMTLGYHNHTPEFGQEGGTVFYDELLRLTDPKLVVFEMDCGWVRAAGQNPVTYLTRSPERFPLLHVKDLAKGPNGEMRSNILGKGVIDYKPIFRAATGLKHYFIEQEEFDGDPIDALTQDAEYMKKLEL